MGLFMFSCVRFCEAGRGHESDPWGWGLKQARIFLLAALLSMLLFSQALCAEEKSEAATASAHGLAWIAPEGRWVIQMQALHDSYSNMYDNEGNKRGLGDDYNGVSLDSAVFPLLALFPAGSSLGTTSISSRVSVQLAQITLGYGVTENLTLGVISSFGQSKSSVNFSVAGGNVGWNPAFNPAAPAGVANIPFAPVGAGAAQAMSTADINSIISNPAFGYTYKPLQGSRVSGMNKVLVGGLWRFYQGEHDSLVAGLGMRKSLAGEKDPDNLFDPRDDGSTDVVAQIEYYRQMGSIFDMRLMVKRTFQLSDERTSRVAAPGQLLALASSKELLHRNMGDFWEFDVEAGASFGDWRVSAVWYRYLKKADHYSSARGQDVSSLISNTGQRADQWRAGVSWSGINAWRQKMIPIPLIIKFEVLDTVRGQNVNAWRDYYLVVTTLF